MNVVSLISRLAQQDIRLWLEDGNLRYSAPEGAMTPEVIASLREAKPAIIAFLAAAKDGVVIEIPHADRTLPLAVSSAQQRLWFLQRLEPENSAYHIHAALWIEGDLDLNRLARACNAILERHEILRTHYEQQGGRLIQIINPPRPHTLNAEPLAAEKVAETLAQERHTPFNLARNEVFRTRLWKTGDRRHLLAFTIHHIAADGWSLGILVQELSALYAAGTASPLPPLPCQYADYAAWQSGNDRHEAVARELAYWKGRLQGVPALALPLDHPRRPQQESAAALLIRQMDSHLTTAFRAMNQAAGTTTFMGMMAALSTLLHRYGNQNDFCIGTPVAGRNAAQLEPLIGCFLNLLAIRCEPDSGMPFQRYLQSIKVSCTEAFAHQDAPFEQLVQEVVTDRDRTTTPLFQVLLSVQNAPAPIHVGVDGLQFTPCEEGEPSAQFDLKLTVEELGGNISLALEYRKALFTHSTMARLADHLLLVLDAVSNHPAVALGDINLFGNRPLLETLGLEQGGLNDTAMPLPENRRIHEIIAQQAAATPDAIAVSDRHATLTYRELETRANALAQHLIALGHKPDGLIGVCLHRSVAMSVALLGILKTGCAYVPFDPDFPAERLAFMAADTGISRIIAGERTLAVAQGIGPAVLTIDTLDFSSAPNAQPLPVVSNQSLFNVIFTSGSTGKPKGVMVPHEGIANRLLWMQRQYPLTASDTVLQKTPYSFDVSAWELFWPLMVGSRYHFADPDAHRDPAAMRDTITTHGITTLHFVPSMLGSFLNTQGIGNCSSIRRVFCSGEALQRQHEELFFQRLPTATLHNLYGPTEASVDVSWYDCGRDNPFSSVPIGRPIDNTQLHILDSQLRPVPTGIAGELHIGGIGLARGYLNRPDLTARAFVENPWQRSGHPSARLYKTGDLARLSEEGEILYLGRIDHQVKIRGNRIELGEIETALLRVEGVRDAVVVACRLPDGDSRLAAYYLSDISIEPQKLVELLSTTLPQTMIPASFQHLEAWPMTPSGKINRNSLPAPDWAQRNRKPYVAPSTDTEQALATIWQEVLRIEKIGVDDNFFELGGHSLNATQVLAMAQERFGVEIPVRKIFDNPSIRPIAALIDHILLEKAVYQGSESEGEDSESFVL